MRFRSLQDWFFGLYVRHGGDPRPPWFLNFVGGERFDELGLGHFKNVRTIAAARPDDRVLDVGCGIGRVALHFAKFLGEHGRYDGFDAVRLGVDWCNARIARRDPRFRFVHVDVYNRQYNPNGLLDAASFSFPYDDEKFSLVYATSVLTHLLPDAAAQYLKEISRVLEPGGRSLVTYFIINDDSRRHMTKSGGLCFQPTEEGYWTTQPENPEAAVAYEERAVWSMYDQASLEIQAPIRYGSWSGRDGLVGGQDHVLASKP
jgi:SAM-dependent methyltransferase